jgi:hypothetical protein
MAQFLLCKAVYKCINQPAVLPSDPDVQPGRDPVYLPTLQRYHRVLPILTASWNIHLKTTFSISDIEVSAMRPPIPVGKPSKTSTAG